MELLLTWYLLDLRGNYLSRNRSTNVTRYPEMEKKKEMRRTRRML